MGTPLFKLQQKMIALNTEINLNPTQFVESQEENMQENGKIENVKNLGNNLLNLKVHDANNVRILMSELLKSTTLAVRGLRRKKSLYYS